jgi:hypothetical protein
VVINQLALGLTALDHHSHRRRSRRSSRQATNAFGENALLSERARTPLELAAAQNRAHRYGSPIRIDRIAVNWYFIWSQTVSEQRALPHLPDCRKAGHR